MHTFLALLPALPWHGMAWQACTVSSVLWLIRLFTDGKLVLLSTYINVYLQNHLVDGTVGSLHCIAIRCGWEYVPNYVCMCVSSKMHTDNELWGRKKPNILGWKTANTKHILRQWLRQRWLEHTHTFLWNETVVWMHTPSADRQCHAQA